MVIVKNRNGTVWKRERERYGFVTGTEWERSGTEMGSVWKRDRERYGNRTGTVSKVTATVWNGTERGTPREQKKYSKESIKSDSESEDEITL